MGCQLSVDQLGEKDGAKDLEERLEERMIMRCKTALHQLPESEATGGFKKRLQGLIDMEETGEEKMKIAAALLAEIMEVVFQQTVQNAQKVLDQLTPEQSEQWSDRLAKIKEAPRATPDTIAAAGAAVAGIIFEMYVILLKDTFSQIKSTLAELPEEQSKPFEEQLQEIANIAVNDVVTAASAAVGLLKLVQVGQVERRLQKIAEFIEEFPPTIRGPFQTRLDAVTAAPGSVPAPENTATQTVSDVDALLADVCVDLFECTMKGIKETLLHVGPDQVKGIQTWITNTEASTAPVGVASVVATLGLFSRIQMHLMNTKVTNIKSLLEKLPAPDAKVFAEELMDIGRSMSKTSHGRTLANQAASALLQRVQDAVKTHEN